METTTDPYVKICMLNIATCLPSPKRQKRAHFICANWDIAYLEHARGDGRFAIDDYLPRGDLRAEGGESLLVHLQASK